MFNQDIKRVGFACKYMVEDQTQHKKVLEELQRPYNSRSTTISWLNRQTKEVAEQRLWDIMVHNIESYKNLITYVSTLQPELRMLRLGSDLLPAYTEPSWRYFWQQAYVQKYLEDNLIKVGDIARQHDVRLSMHPGQFVVLASDRPEVVERSIEEFEYHVDCIKFMGYGKEFQDFKCNVHISGRQGPTGIINVLPRLSKEARNVITIENDENSWGIEDSLELGKHLALVLDIHHHWVKSGEYIQPSDDRFKGVIDSWRGLRPAMHYSVSRLDYLIDHDVNTLPDKELLLEQGYKKGKMRGHSDFMWNNAVNTWASTFNEFADIMVESKAKNLASIKFFESFNN
jgi:UV DNA damage repair endonuclease|tara:strand:+ start:2685 stop:3713 length:1029 start_codon:yes stop_codon:yes gene_type:complete